MIGKSTTGRWAFVLIALAVFLVRGPLRFAQNLDHRADFASPFVGAKAWAQGLNPYTSSTFGAVWKQASGRAVLETDSRESRPPYPLSAFVVLAPLTPLPWRAAKIAAMVLTLAVVGAAVIALGRLLPDSNARLVFAALAMAMAPLYTGMAATAVGIWRF